MEVDLGERAQQEALLAAITASPDDEALRLVYADWLEEHGEPERGELIRVQCELERLPAALPRAAELRRRSTALSAAHEREWLGEWSERLVRWTFRRGFLDAVVVTPEPFLRHGGELFRDHPVRRFTFVNAEGEPVADEVVTEVGSSPHLAHIRSLDVTGCSPDEPSFRMYGGQDAVGAWCRALAGATHVMRLEELLLRGGLRWGYQEGRLDGLRALASAPHLRTLRTLEFWGADYESELGDNLLDIIAASSFGSNLTSLALPLTHITDAGLARFAALPVTANLRRVDFTSCPDLTAAGVHALLYSPRLTRLADIGLEMAPGVLSVLAGSPRLGQLQAIALTRGYQGSTEPVGTAEWTRLARAPHLALRRFTLAGWHDVVSADGLRELLASPALAEVEELRLNLFSVLLEGALEALFTAPVSPKLAVFECRPSLTADQDALASWPGLTRLAEFSQPDARWSESRGALFNAPHCPTAMAWLDLGSSLTEKGILALAACPRLSALTWLGLAYSDWTEAAMAAVLTSPYLQNLEALHLGSEPGHAAALSLLARVRGLPRLRDLVVGSEADSDALVALRRRFGPRLRIWADC